MRTATIDGPRSGRVSRTVCGRSGVTMTAHAAAAAPRASAEPRAARIGSSRWRRPAAAMTTPSTRSLKAPASNHGVRSRSCRAALAVPAPIPMSRAAAIRASQVTRAAVPASRPRIRMDSIGSARNTPPSATRAHPETRPVWRRDGSAGSRDNAAGMDTGFSLVRRL